MRFSINQRFLRDLRQVATKTFGRTARNRPRTVQFFTQFVDGRHQTRAVIQEAGVTLTYTGTEEQDDTCCFEIDLKVLQPFESARDSGVLIRGDLETGTATICADVQSRISQQSGVAIGAADPHPASEPVASAEFAHSILDELAQATSIADPNSGREALRCLSLDGSRRTLAATDGRKALITDRLDWPWADERLIARNGWFSAAAVRKAASRLVVSDSGETVRFTAGPWSLELPCETHRFPDVVRVIPRSEDCQTTLHLGEDDLLSMQEAAKAFSKTGVETFSSVTFDLTAHPTLRAHSESGRSSVVLPTAVRHGAPLRIALGRHVLNDIARLQLTTLRFVDAHQALCRTVSERTYVAMPLHPEFVVATDREDSPRRSQAASQPVATASR